MHELPNEVLLSIWEQLDDPVPLSCVSRRFQELSKDPLWRARWFMQRYEIYMVMFEAIARPKLFAVELFERLIRLGAPLSRTILQLLNVIMNSASREALLRRKDEIRWGRINFPAYAAIMQHAASLVGLEQRSSASCSSSQHALSSDALLPPALHSTAATCLSRWKRPIATRSSVSLSSGATAILILPGLIPTSVFSVAGRGGNGRRRLAT